MSKFIKTVRNFNYVLLMSIFILTGCNEKKDKATANPELGEVTYTVTVNTNWSSSTHPDGFPNSPHFSGFIGTSHNINVKLWEGGMLASEGIQLVAERGSKNALTTEINTLISGGDANELISEGGIGTSPGELSFSIIMRPDYTYISLVSMLAPSPDWIIGVAGLNLAPAGVWLDSKTIELYVYDAGTDDGNSYTAANQASSPKEAIFRLESTPFLVNNEVTSIGIMTITRQ